jgi:hypothetical protein
MRSAVRVGVRPFPKNPMVSEVQPFFQSFLRRKICIKFDKIAPNSIKIGAKFMAIYIKGKNRLGSGFRSKRAFIAPMVMALISSDAIARLKSYP